jgi:hypothetical protein
MRIGSSGRGDMKRPKTLYRVGKGEGIYRVVTTVIDGLYVVRGPGVMFSNGSKNLPLMQEIADMAANAFIAGKASLTRMF